MGVTVHRLGRKYQPVRKQINFKEKPTYRVGCLYSSFVHGLEVWSMHGAVRWLSRLPAEWYIGPGSILDPGTLIAGSRFPITISQRN
jgi:hypothetical protein